MERICTVSKRNQALVRDLKLERVEESGRIVQNCDICDIYSAHGLGFDTSGAAGLRLKPY